MNLSETIKTRLEYMTKSEQRIAAYYFKSPNGFAFNTLGEVARDIDTSTTSVIRFCQKIGFNGYKDFQFAVRDSFRFGLTLPDKFKITVDINNSSSPLSKTVSNAVACIEQTFYNFDEALINKAVAEILSAQRVFCFGLKESYALAHYAYTRFLTVRSNVYMLTSGQSGEIESILSLNKSDICIFFLFHRYTHPAPKILELLKKQGVKIILVTSPPFDDIEKGVEILFPCSVNINGIKNSSVAPICLLDHICNALVVSNSEKGLEYMRNCEALFKDFTF
ncbi:MAG: MurR/RpiR family transcriptional regulator [Clostridia bacterium]|nr:MurR/RpiR family transcriptional regulator [Clostridia bacterium]